MAASCAVLGGFAVGARVALLYGNITRSVSEYVLVLALRLVLLSSFGVERCADSVDLLTSTPAACCCCCWLAHGRLDSRCSRGRSVDGQSVINADVVTRCAPGVNDL